MLPTLSRLSVSNGPADCLRHWCSSRSLRIPPLHREFHPPLPCSSLAVSKAALRLSRSISPPTYKTAYAPFTPSDSGQRSHPLYYRGCWHRVSRCFLSRYRQFIRPSRQWFTIRRPSSHTRRRCVRLSPIAQDSPLLPPVGVWAVSQSQCGWSSSQTSYPSSPWWAITPPTS